MNDNINNINSLSTIGESAESAVDLFLCGTDDGIPLNGVVVEGPPHAPRIVVDGVTNQNKGDLFKEIKAVFQRVCPTCEVVDKGLVKNEGAPANVPAKCLLVEDGLDAHGNRRFTHVRVWLPHEGKPYIKGKYANKKAADFKDIYGPDIQALRERIRAMVVASSRRRAVARAPQGPPRITNQNHPPSSVSSTLEVSVHSGVTFNESTTFLEGSTHSSVTFGPGLAGAQSFEAPSSSSTVALVTPTDSQNSSYFQVTDPGNMPPSLPSDADTATAGLASWHSVAPLRHRLPEGHPNDGGEPPTPTLTVQHSHCHNHNHHQQDDEDQDDEASFAPDSMVDVVELKKAFDDCRCPNCEHPQSSCQCSLCW